jgi:hypothetical protein
MNRNSKFNSFSQKTKHQKTPEKSYKIFISFLDCNTTVNLLQIQIDLIKNKKSFNARKEGSKSKDEEEVWEKKVQRQKSFS